tara:strand:+ start:234 stop:524 length:291 start_codon:yes stop_codon:yes gene_type:complete
MKTFKQFMEQTVPVLPRAHSGDIHRSRNNRRFFGLGRKNKVSDFDNLRYGGDGSEGNAAGNTNKKAPEYNAQQMQYPTRGPRELRFRHPNAPTGVM